MNFLLTKYFDNSKLPLNSWTSACTVLMFRVLLVRVEQKQRNRAH